MKFTSYATRLDGTTAYVFGGAAVDRDFEGGLEEVLDRLVEKGIRRIVITLKGMKFLHATLFAGLLNVQARLEQLNGDLILADVPWFVEMSLNQLGVLHRFALVPNSHTVHRASMMKVDLEQFSGKSAFYPS